MEMIKKKKEMNKKMKMRDEKLCQFLDGVYFRSLISPVENCLKLRLQNH